MSLLAKHCAWLKEAERISLLPADEGGSPHPDVKVGAIIVDSKGKKLAAASNRMASGVDWRKPRRTLSGRRSLWINCAEQMAIADAARRGGKTKGARLYLTLEPCATCAGVMIEAGISELIIPAGAARKNKKLKPKWRRSIKAGLAKLKEAGVQVTRIAIK
jgi:tRNA(Arg) A34 adenosine deaminase TadA